MPKQRVVSTKSMRTAKQAKLRMISGRVVQVREQLGLTQKEVGDQLGVTSVSVYQAEKLYSTLLFEIIILFANTYNVNPSWILVEDNSGISQVLERTGAVAMAAPAHVEQLTADQLATRIRRDVLKLKELVEKETLIAKSRPRKTK